MKEEILKLAEKTLTPIGWYGEKAKSIEGIEEFVERVMEILEAEESRSDK